MSRVQAPRKPGPFARAAYWMSRRDYGQVPEPVEVTAHHPGILRGYGIFEWETSRAKAVDSKLKDLGAIKAAAMVGCEFCLDIGSALGAKAGITAEQLAELPRYRESDSFDETHENRVSASPLPPSWLKKSARKVGAWPMATFWTSEVFATVEVPV